jgi:flavodoxin
MIMNSIRLLYFSPTGTTRKILEAIAEGLGVDKPEHISPRLKQEQARAGRSKAASLS